MNRYPLLMKYIESMCLVTKESYEFRIGKTPVTVGLWKEYVSDCDIEMPPSPEWGWIDNHPIVNVSWKEIMASDGFCAWATEITNMPLTLPTNSQWTYASTDQYGSRFPWGNEFDISKLWCSGEVHRDSGGTAAVDRTNHIYVNSYGLSDVLGNVWDWCLDQYTDEEIGWTGPSRFRNPRVIRGCCWQTRSFKPSGAVIPGLGKVRADGDKYRDSIGFRLISP